MFKPKNCRRDDVNDTRNGICILPCVFRRTTFEFLPKVFVKNRKTERRCASRNMSNCRAIIIAKEFQTECVYGFVAYLAVVYLNIVDDL